MSTISMPCQCFNPQNFNIPKNVESCFFKKSHIKIVITDLGLGGLSVFDGIIRQTKKIKNNHYPFKKINLIYYNCEEQNINDRYKKRDIKDEILSFNKHLLKIFKYFKPDLIMIACNTLSVLYPKTDVFKMYKNKIPIVNVVSFGVDIFYEALMANDTNRVVIFGEPITIQVNSHKKLLHSKNKQLLTKIVTQSCTKIAADIEEHGPNHPITLNSIRNYVKQSFKKLDEKTDTVFAGLCCTHYGYAMDLWKHVFNVDQMRNVIIVNPNDEMTKWLIMKNGKNDKFYRNCDITTIVYSCGIDIRDEEIENIKPLLAKESIEALTNWVNVL